MMEELIIFGISTLLGLGSFGAMAWTALSPETLDLDKIFSIIVCLVLGLIFFSISGWMLFHTRLRELWRTKQPAAPAPEPKKASVAAAPTKEPVAQEAGKSV